MSKLKENLNQIGFSFDELDTDEIERKNRIYRQIQDLKRQQKKIENIAKLYEPTNIEELRQVWRELNKQVKELEI